MQPGLTWESQAKPIKVFRKGFRFKGRDVVMDWCWVGQPIQDTGLNNCAAGAINFYLGAMSRIKIDV